MKKVSDNIAYEDLANAIILQALKDYSMYLKKIQKIKSEEEYKNISDKIVDIVKFLYSEHFCLLSNTDPDYLIKNVKKRVYNKQ